MKSSRLALLCLAALSVTPGTANAHIKLLKPASWVTTDSSGNPQKMGPCGTASAGSAATNMVTTFTAGEEITVEWNETVDHPGHYRIALAKDRAELKDPDLKPPAGSCDYPAGSVPTAPHGNVLLDNLFPTTASGGARTFSQKVKLPDEPCEKCTLQLIQWMTKHPPSCLYYQCADIKIVAAGAPAAGSGAAGASAAGSGAAGKPAAGSGAAGTPAAGSNAAGIPAAGSGSGEAGKPAAGSGAAGSAGAEAVPPPASSESEGCSVSQPGRPRSSLIGLVLLFGIAQLARRRAGVRRRHPRLRRSLGVGLRAWKRP